MSEPACAMNQPVRPLALFGVAVTGVLASALLGAITNAINGWVSPLYFVAILRWQGIEDVWRASIAQGIFEGLIFGIFFSLIFTAGAGIITKAACTYRFAVRYLLGVTGGAAIGCVTGWFIGGSDLGGRLFGLTLGWLVSTCLGLGLLRAHWLRNQPQANPATMPEPLPNGNAAPSS